MKRICAALLLLSLTSAASANIVYSWETLTTSSTISSAAGRLEITDAAWASGQASYTAAPTCPSLTNCDYGNPSSPVVQFSFRVNAPNPTPADINLNFVEGTGLVFPLNDWFRASFTIQGPTLNFDAFANTGETDMRMVSNTITRFGSDSPFFGAACFNPGCSGAAGQWVQVQAQIPEPSSIALLGIGVLSLLYGRRTRGNRHS